MWAAPTQPALACSSPTRSQEKTIWFICVVSAHDAAAPMKARSRRWSLAAEAGGVIGCSSGIGIDSLAMHLAAGAASRTRS